MAQVDPGTASSIASALIACERVTYSTEELSLAELYMLATTCTSAQRSLEVATALCRTVACICGPDRRDASANRVSCGAAGVVRAILGVMRTYAPGSSRVAALGCRALGYLAHHNEVNADVLVMSPDSNGGLGLNVIESAMMCQQRDAEAQYQACGALVRIADAVSPSAMRVLQERRSSESLKKLLNAAKSNHPEDRDLNKKADMALAALTGRASR